MNEKDFALKKITAWFFMFIFFIFMSDDIFATVSVDSAKGKNVNSHNETIH